MNYYERYIGDYQRDTARLSLAEHGAYTMLLDTYYATEKPLPADYPALCRICRAYGAAEQKAVKSIADQFFPIAEDGLRHNTKADELIPDALRRIHVAQLNGKKGGRPRRNEPGGSPTGIPTENPAGYPAGPQQGTQRQTSPTPTPLVSVPNGTGGGPPGEQAGKPKTAEEMTKTELWRAGKSVLLQAGMPKDQCGTFVGMLCKDYGDDVVIEAVRETVLKQPADPASFLKAACMARKGEGGKTLIPWHATDEGVIAKGLALDPPLKPYPGQSTIAFKTRVLAAVENDGKEPAQPTRPLVTLPDEPVRMTDEAVEQGRAAIRAAAGVKERTNT